jgi:hypothetical protein
MRAKLIATIACRASLLHVVPVARPKLSTAAVIAALAWGLMSGQVFAATNLIKNGDFSDGNKFFESDYKYNPGNMVPAATYDVITKGAAQLTDDNAAFVYPTCRGASSLPMVLGTTRIAFGFRASPWRQIQLMVLLLGLARCSTCLRQSCNSTSTACSLGLIIRRQIRPTLGHSSPRRIFPARVDWPRSRYLTILHPSVRQ